MDTKLLLILILGAAVLAPSPSLAKNNDHKGYFAKVANAYGHKHRDRLKDLGLVQQELAALSALVDAIESDVGILSDEVGQSGEDLSALIAEIDQYSTLPPYVIEEMKSRREERGQDIDSIKELIVMIDDEIIALSNEARALSSDLANSIDEMIGSLERRRKSPAYPALEAIAVSSGLTVVNTRIHGLNADIRGLEHDVAEQVSLISLLDMRLGGTNEPDAASISSIAFETLNVNCSATSERTLDYSVNGAIVAQSNGYTPGACGPSICTPPVMSVEADLTGVSLAGDGSDLLAIVSAASPMHYVRWSRAIVSDSSGNTQTYCLFDGIGGDCTETNICAGGYTDTSINGSQNF